MKYSRQRELILDTLKESHSHPTAEELYTEVKKLLPSISLGTVYRNLNLLTEKGLIRKVESADSFSVRYDGRSDEHIHLLCTECNEMKDVDVDLFKLADEKIKEETGFTVLEHGVILRGVCKECALLKK